MKNIAISAFILFFHVSLYSQEQQDTITNMENHPCYNSINYILNTPNTNGGCYEARDFVTLEPGFSFSATNTKSFTGKLDENILFDVQYLQNFDPNTIPINTNLPVGATEGVFDVSAAGAANYVIPLKFPAGIIMPTLNIAYNSQGGDGMLGKAWFVGGLSSISRVGNTIYNDGFVKGIKFNSDSRLALDGNRLIAISGNYWQENTIYHTENENFSEIKIYGDFNTQKYNSIEVKAKNGLTYIYGETEDAKIELQNSDGIISWLLSSVRDNHGNYMNYHYIEDHSTGEYYIDYIEYSGNTVANQLPYNKIQFFYVSSDSPNVQYINGCARQQKRLLHKIKITHNGSVFKKYEFNYTSDFIPHLSEIIEYGSDNVAYNSTLIKWGDKPLDYQIKENVYWQGLGNCYNADYNGDGLLDMLNVTENIKTTADSGNNKDTANLSEEMDTIPNEEGISGHWKLYLNNGSDFVLQNEGDLATHNWNLAVTNCPGGGFFNPITLFTLEPQINKNGADFNGDGLPDLLGIDRKCLQSNFQTVFAFYPIFSDGNSFTVSQEKYFYFFGRCDKYWVGDFDGDRVDDIFAYAPTSNYYVIYSFAKNRAISEGIINLNSEAQLVIDFNGNGKMDLMLIGNSSSIIYELNEMSPLGSLVQLYSGNLPTIDYEPVFADFNGDGKTDFFYGYNNPSHIYFSTETGFLPICIQDVILPSYPNIPSGIFSYDVNGDGKTDLVVPYKTTSHIISYPYDFRIRIFYNKSISATSTSFEMEDFLVNENVENRDFNHFWFGDYNGDGQTDMYYNCHKYELFSPDEDIYKLIFFKPNNKQHLVHSIIDGLKARVDFDYKYLTNNEVYGSGSSVNYPLVRLRRGIPVVAMMRFTNGIKDKDTDGNNYRTYYYSGLTMHQQGKGMLGFQSTLCTDFTQNLKTHNYYSFHPQYFFSKLDGTVIKYNNENISEINYVNDVKVIHSAGKVIAPYISKKTDKDLLKNITITTDYTCNNNYGNMDQIKTNFSGEGEEIIDNIYITAGTWCPSQISESVITHKIPGLNDYMRKTAFQYNAQGMLTSNTTDPDSTKYVTTTYGYDPDYGVKTSTTIAAANLSTISESFEYDQYRRFVTKHYNSLNQITETFYNTVSGNIVKQKDINGLVTSYQYDGFGRVTQVQQPSGLTVTTSLKWNTNPNLINYVQVVYYSENIKGNQIAKDYFDVLRRNVRSEIIGFNGASILSDTRYQADGKVYQTSEPYYSGEAQRLTTFYYDKHRITRKVLPNCSFVYTYNGRTITITNENNNQFTSKTMNAMGRITQANDMGGTISYTYNAAGEVKEISALNSTTYIEYDGYGNKTMLNDPNAGIIRYTYNAYGQITSQTDANQKTYQIGYDLMGRVTSKSGPDGIINYTYDTKPNGKGLLSETNYSNGTKYEFFYNELSRLQTEKQVIDGAAYNTHYTYDAEGKITSIRYPSDYVINNNYNQYGYLAEVKQSNGALIWKANTMNARMQVTEAAYGNNLINQKTYDATGMPDANKTGYSGNWFVQNWDYNFDAVSGVLLSRKDMKRNLLEEFVTDNLNRICTTKTNQTITQQINYHPQNGNITHKTDAGDYVYDGAQPHAVTKLHNNGGTIPVNAEQLITYTAFNKVATITEGNKYLEYIYGPDLQRKVSKYYLNGQLHCKRIYAGNYEEEQYDGKTRKLHYIYSPDGLVGIFVKNDNKDTMYYIHTDYQGTIMAISNQSGTLVAELSYDAWGRRRNPANWSYSGFASPLFVRGYTGHEHLVQFGLINMNGRCYDPLLGRFLSTDMFVQYPEHTQSYNRYGYVLNNPTIYTDPSGQFLIPWLFAAAVKIIVYGAIIYFTASEIKGIGESIKTGDWTNADTTLAGTSGNNSLRITNGLFITDRTLDDDEQVLQVIKRFTWQLPTTIGGYLMGQSWNVFKDVQRVDYFYGATVIYDRCYNEYAGAITNSAKIGFSIGGFIVEDLCHYEELGTNASDVTLVHEYGHYLQEQAWGPLTLISGIESSKNELCWPKILNQQNVWVERDANQRALNYLRNKEKNGFNKEEFLKEGPASYGGKYYEERLTNLLLISAFLIIF